MTIYEVNLSVDESITQSFGVWLKEHIAEILKIPGFESATWFTREPVEGEDASQKTLWTVHYVLKNRESLEDYFTHHAQRMRQDGLSRFEGKFTASRRVLNEFEL